MNPDQDGALVGPTFREILDLIGRGLAYAVLVGLLLAVFVWELSKRSEPIYRATATVLSYYGDGSNNSFSHLNPSPLDALGYSTALMGDAVMADAMQRLGTSEPSEAAIDRFRNDVSVSFDETRSTTVLRIRVEDASGSRAAEAATALAESLRAWDANRIGQGITRTVAALQGELAALDSRIATLVDGESTTVISRPEYQDVLSLRTQRQAQLVAALALTDSATGSLVITQPAVTPLQPTYPRPLVMALAAFMFGVVLVYGLILIRHFGDRHVRSIDALTLATGAPPLARFGRNHVSSNEFPSEPNSYLRARLSAADWSQNGHSLVVLVTSSRDYANQDRIAIGLAKSFLQSGVRTLLVDADMHSHKVTRRLRVPQEEATELLSFLRRPTVAETTPPLGHTKSLSVVPSFVSTSRSADLLSSGIEHCLGVWRNAYDVIVISSAPMLPVADAVVLAPLCDRVVLGVTVGTTTLSDLTEARGLLDRVAPGRWGTAAVNVDAQDAEEAKEARRRRTSTRRWRGDRIPDAADGRTQ